MTDRINNEWTATIERLEKENAELRRERDEARDRITGIVMSRLADAGKITRLEAELAECRGRLEAIRACYEKWHHLGADTNADILWQAIKKVGEDQNVPD